jgi:hypothetical protein
MILSSLIIGLIEYRCNGFMRRYPLGLIMSLKQKIILAGMIIRGVATFGLMAYAMFNFARWMIENSQEVEDALSEETLELRIQ